MARLSPTHRIKCSVSGSTKKLSDDMSVPNQKSVVPTSRPIRVRFAPSPTGYLHVGGAAPRFSTGFSLETSAARSSCELKTPTSSAIAPNWSKAFSMGSVGWASIGMRARFISRSAWRVTAPPRTNCSPPAPPISATARPKNMRAATRRSRTNLRTQSEITAHHPLRLPRRQTFRPPDKSLPCVFGFPLGETTHFEDAVFGPREVSNDEIEDFVLCAPFAARRCGRAPCRLTS